MQNSARCSSDLKNEKRPSPSLKLAKDGDTSIKLPSPRTEDEKKTSSADLTGDNSTEPLRSCESTPRLEGLRDGSSQPASGMVPDSTPAPGMARAQFTVKKDLKCELCGEVLYVDLDFVEHHIRADQKTRKEHRCSFCPYSTPRKGDMVRHTMIHTGERPFTCDVCSAKFNQKSILKRHRLTHEAIGPRQCAQCFRRFRTDTDLQDHKLRYFHR